MMRRSLFSFLLFSTMTIPLAAHSEKNDCPPRWVNRTLFTTGAAVIGIGGGAWAGYVAGHNRQRSPGNAEVKNPLCAKPSNTDEGERSIEWILPEYIPPFIGVEAVLYKPDQSVFAQARLTPFGIFNSTLPDTIGGEENPGQIGLYTLVLTLQGDVFPAGVGAFLGGLRFGGEAIQGDPVPPDPLFGGVRQGTQIVLTIPFPEGPHGKGGVG